MEALTVRPTLPLDSPEDAILGVPILVADVGIPPLSQIELAVALNPTFTIFWLGSNDTLGAVLGADPAAVTPFPVFQQAYQMAVGAILSTGSQMVIGNIPDVTITPFLTPAQTIAALLGAPLEVIGPVLGIGSGDFVTAPGVTLASAILTGQAPGPLPGNVVLTAEEASAITAATAQMNALIAGVGLNFNVPVVDVRALYQMNAFYGIPISLISNRMEPPSLAPS